jgi:ABC-type multidrug transport system fused ATPase/permease subunit
VSADKRFFTALLAVLTPAQRRRYVALQAYFIFAGVAQVAGAGSIAPFVALLSDPTILHRNALASRLYTLGGFTSDNAALSAFAVAMMFVLVISNLIAAGAVWGIFRFSLKLGSEFQRDLFVAYLYRDYVDLARTNSATLIATISQGAARFTYNVVQPLLFLTSQATIVLAVILLLTIYRPSIALSFALLVGGGYGLLFMLVRRKLLVHGNRSWDVQQEKQRLLTEGLGGLKEIRLAGTAAAYQRRYESSTLTGLRSEAMVGMYGDLPRFVLETLAFCALLWLAVILLGSKESPGDIVAVLSLYAMTGYRILPAAQSIFKSAAQLRANAPVIHELLPDILAGRAAAELEKDSDSVELVDVGTVVFDDVWFSYPGSESPVLKGISVEIRPRELTVIVGPSGSGKSTFADLLLGLLRPDQGQITVDGRSLESLGRSWKRSLGYVPQSIFLLDDSIAANIAFGSSEQIDPAKLRHAARLASLEHVIVALPDGFEYRVGERGSMLSGGQRQRLGIARALYHDANLLILDEATSALDGATEGEVLETLLQLRKSKSVVMIAHRMSTIRAADRILLLNQGRIEAVGTYDDLILSSEGFRKLAQLGSESVEVESDFVAT